MANHLQAVSRRKQEVHEHPYTYRRLGEDAKGQNNPDARPNYRQFASWQSGRFHKLHAIYRDGVNLAGLNNVRILFLVLFFQDSSQLASSEEEGPPLSFVFLLASAHGRRNKKNLVRAIAGEAAAGLQGTTTDRRE